MNTIISFGVLVAILPSFSCSPSPPHILLVVVDDLGWSDIGYNNITNIRTPNIDQLATEGVILNNYYVQAVCTPTRSALMTGIYPIHTGETLETKLTCQCADMSNSQIETVVK